MKETIKEDEEEKVKTRETESRKIAAKLPWMEELKMNQMKRSSKPSDMVSEEITHVEEKIEKFSTERKVPVSKPASGKPDEGECCLSPPFRDEFLVLHFVKWLRINFDVFQESFILWVFYVFINELRVTKTSLGQVECSF